MKFSSFIPALLATAVVAAPTPDEEYATILKRAEEEMALITRQIPTLPCSHQTGGLHVIAAGGANTANVSQQLAPNIIPLMLTIPPAQRLRLPRQPVAEHPCRNPRLHQRLPAIQQGLDAEGATKALPQCRPRWHETSQAVHR